MRWFLKHMTHTTIQQIINLSGEQLVCRSVDDAEQRRAELQVLLPLLPESAVEFFSSVSGGMVFGADPSVPVEHYSYLVDEGAPLVSVNEELDAVGIGLENDEGADYFANCYPVFRSPIDFQYAWCISLNPGDTFGQVFFCHIFFSEHPGDSARVWASSFDAWLDWILADYLAWISDPELARNRTGQRSTFPPLRWG